MFCEFYEDEKLKKKFDAAKVIDSTKLRASSPLKLYIKPLKKGKFDLELKPEKSNDPRFRLVEDKEEQKQSMAVVELQVKVHQQDGSATAGLTCNPDQATSAYHNALKSLKIPEQVELSDKDKIVKGRLLHVQESGNFGRAKLILPKLDPSEWPDGCDDYEILIGKSDKTISGDFKVFDAEFDGKEETLLRFKIKDLQAQEKILWLEGTAETTKNCELRLDLQLDRKAGGAKNKIKKNLDWANFTVVKIHEVKLAYQQPGPTDNKASAWSETEGKFYVNIQQVQEGNREVSIKVSLSQKIKDVPVHVMLIESRGNRKNSNWGKDLPSNWQWENLDEKLKHEDKKSRTDFLHLSGKTDVNGEVTISQLRLSQFGGDIFTPAAYITEDPHLAKHIDGHKELGKKVPVKAQKEINIWRKFWYDEIKVKGINLPGPGSAVDKWKEVRVSMEKAGTVNITEKQIPSLKTTVYPRYMIEGGGGNTDALVVSDKNKVGLFAFSKPSAEHPLKVPLLICDAQWDTDGNTKSRDTGWLRSHQFPFNFSTKKDVLSPPLDGGDLLVSGKWTTYENDNKGNWVNKQTGLLEEGDLHINPNRPDIECVEVKWPAKAPPIGPDVTIKIENFSVKGAADYLGEYSPRYKTIMCVYDPKQSADFQNTIAHEFGHAFGQTSKGGKDGMPAHSNWYQSYGDHCNYSTNRCLMYESGPIANTLGEFCEVCHPYVLSEDMSRLA